MRRYNWRGCHSGSALIVLHHPYPFGVLLQAKDAERFLHHVHANSLFAGRHFFGQILNRLWIDPRFVLARDDVASDWHRKSLPPQTRAPSCGRAALRCFLPPRLATRQPQGSRRCSSLLGRAGP